MRTSAKRLRFNLYDSFERSIIDMTKRYNSTEKNTIKFLVIKISWCFLFYLIKT